ncbi:MAG: hypothetical protein MZV70_36560 [Desulfobacterales bacterium]|nr:hypothetical protein [Desulfobacterales bacterium]
MEISDDYKTDLVRFWKVRLASETDINTNVFSKLDLFIVIIISLGSGLLAKLPAILSQINPEFFYTRNLAIIVFNGLIIYTFGKTAFLIKKELLFTV